jgi:hypothetical protein
MGFLDWLLGPGDIPTDSEFPTPVHLARGRGFTFEVVGEANYQDALDVLCGGKCEDGHKLEARAQLIFQEDNPYDPNAIAVLIDRRLVGYVPRDLARSMRSAILTLNPEERPVTCDALVVGGWLRDEDDEGHYGVRLSLAHPLRLATAR